MRERNVAQCRAVNSKAESDWNEYKQLRNQVNQQVKIDKKLWQSKKLKTFGNDTGSLWKNVKDWFGWSKQGSPSKLVEKGNIHTKPKEMARIMNNHFVNKVDQHISDLQPPISCPLDPVRRIMQYKSCNMTLEAVHPDTINRIIDTMRSSSSSGLDNVDSKILKLSKAHIIPSITHIVNFSITTQTFPSDWKIAKIVPIHKKKDVTLPANYRPVSLLSSISKVAEQAVYLQLVSYFETNKLIHPAHHGFRTGHSTTTALIQMQQQ